MRPLPRLFAIVPPPPPPHPTDLQECAIQIAGVGPVVTLVARLPGADGQALSDLTAELMSVAGPAESTVTVVGRPDIAAIHGASGIQLRHNDLKPDDARRVHPSCQWIGRSVHSVAEATAALEEEADYLLFGSVYRTPTHPELAPAGLDALQAIVALGAPVIAIGGMTPKRAKDIHSVGAWGLASISTLWNATNPSDTALAFLQPWLN